MARTAALYAVPAALIVTGWLSLEGSPRAWGPAVLLAGVAVVPALVRPWWLRVLAAVAGVLVAARVAVGVSIFDARPFDGGHDFFGPLGSRFGNGVAEFYDVLLPFDPARRPNMQDAVLVGIFVFCLALGLSIAARRPLAAGLVLVVGAGWPATLLPHGSAAVLRGALILAALLVLLAGMRESRGRAFPAALVTGGLVVACALAASTSPAVAKSEFLHWQTWNFHGATKAVGVSYVWDADYTGLHWPKKETGVLRIRSDSVHRYWRATTLDTFRDDHWVQDLNSAFPRVVSPSRDVLSTVRFLPPDARDSRNWVRQDVSVLHLRDDHLTGAAVPVAYSHQDFPGVSYARGGVAFVSPGVENGNHYTVWSYAARPSPAKLAASKPNYPAALQADDLGVWVNRWSFPFGPRSGVPAFLVPTAYGPLARRARQVVGHARTPYAAAVTLETWFRESGGFIYDDHPPPARGLPPLVSFLQTKRGYCQHFAGAMALMLRYLGIPARVAVGFTSGKYDPENRTWTVTDHDAHAWVEVWFKGYGWLPFDPTPGRGTLGAPYSTASGAFDATSAVTAVKGAPKGVRSLLEEKARLQKAGKNTFQSERPFAVTGGAQQQRSFAETARANGASLLKLLAIVLAAALATIVGVKYARRRIRYFTRDPRRLASACRRELVEFLVDQRLPVGPSSTLGDVARELDDELGVRWDEFFAAASRARFGTPAEAQSAADDARRELGDLRRQLRHRLGTADRVRGMVSFRSLRSA